MRHPEVFDSGTQAFRQMDGIRKVGLRQEDGEFLAAPAAHRIGFAGALLQRPGEQDQGLVALFMAELVVMCLKWSTSSSSRQ